MPWWSTKVRSGMGYFRTDDETSGLRASARARRKTCRDPLWQGEVSGLRLATLRCRALSRLGAVARLRPARTRCALPDSWVPSAEGGRSSGSPGTTSASTEPWSSGSNAGPRRRPAIRRRSHRDDGPRRVSSVQGLRAPLVASSPGSLAAVFREPLPAVRQILLQRCNAVLGPRQVRLVSGEGSLPRVRGLVRGWIWRPPEVDHRQTAAKAGFAAGRTASTAACSAVVVGDLLAGRRIDRGPCRPARPSSPSAEGISAGRPPRRRYGAARPTGGT